MHLEELTAAGVSFDQGTLDNLRHFHIRLGAVILKQSTMDPPEPPKPRKG